MVSVAGWASSPSVPDLVRVGNEFLRMSARTMEILCMVVKSCITKRMVETLRIDNGMFTTYQLVIRISLAHPPYFAKEMDQTDI